MNNIKRYLGVLWLVLAPAILFFLINSAILHIDTAGKKDINNPVIWVIIITIFAPIGTGLMIFGWYALKGEYDHLPENSSEIEDD